jgi:hypothetical protein
MKIYGTLPKKLVIVPFFGRALRKALNSGIFWTLKMVQKWYKTGRNVTITLRMVQVNRLWITQGKWKEMAKCVIMMMGRNCPPKAA